MLIAGTGTDSFIGGFGNDVFQFLSTASSNPTSRDIVQTGDGAVAFERPGGGVLGDQFDLSRIDANEVANGTQDFVFGNSHAVGQLWAVDVGNLTIIRGNTGGDTAPELEIAILDGNVHASAYTTRRLSWSETSVRVSVFCDPLRLRGLHASAVLRSWKTRRRML